METTRDIRTYTYDVPRETELDIDWIIEKTKKLAKANPSADFNALIQDAIVSSTEDNIPEFLIEDIVDDILWDRKDDFAEIATKYSDTCTYF